MVRAREPMAEPMPIPACWASVRPWCSEGGSLEEVCGREEAVLVLAFGVAATGGPATTAVDVLFFVAVLGHAEDTEAPAHIE